MSARKTTVQTVTVGRIVHYYTDPAGEQRAALVSDVEDAEFVTLHVLNDSGVHVLGCVPHAPVPTPGHWSWPDVAPVPADDEDGDEN